MIGSIKYSIISRDEHTAQDPERIGAANERTVAFSIVLEQVLLGREWEDSTADAKVNIDERAHLRTIEKVQLFTRIVRGIESSIQSVHFARGTKY